MYEGVPDGGREDGESGRNRGRSCNVGVLKLPPPKGGKKEERQTGAKGRKKGHIVSGGRGAKKWGGGVIQGKREWVRSQLWWRRTGDYGKNVRERNWESRGEQT